MTLRGPELLANARRRAALAHSGALDATGAPYQGHLDRVTSLAEIRRAQTAPHLDRYETAAVALLHDAVEDGVTTLEELAADGMPPQVLATTATGGGKGRTSSRCFAR